jgi:hypothetical protein
MLTEPPKDGRVYAYRGDSITVVLSGPCRVWFLNQDEHDRLTGDDTYKHESTRFEGAPITFGVNEKGHYWVLSDDDAVITSFLLRDSLGHPVDRSDPRKRPR